MISERNFACPLFFVLEQKRGKSSSLPILHPYPSTFTPPSPAPAEQRQLLFVSYMLCLRLGVRMCLFTDRGTAESVCLFVYLWAAEMGGGNNPEDNVRPCAY